MTRKNKSVVNSTERVMLKVTLTNESDHAVRLLSWYAPAEELETKPVTVDCKCKKAYYAYVYPNQPYKIYLFKGFWSAPLSGTDSKAGTLIHERSYFDVVAATDDWGYGQSDAKSLAISDPAKALNNANSHQYFAENTPASQ